MKNVVIYKWYVHQKYNGSVYYAFEYFAYLSQNDPDLEFLLVNINDQDLNDLKRSFSNKYKNIEHLFKKFKSTTTTSLYNIKMNKALILDLRTYHEVYCFLQCPMHVYSNESHSYRVPKKQQVTFYGEYAYQDFDIKCKLKLNFDIMKDIQSSETKTFISSRVPEQLNIKEYTKKHNLKNVILKHLDKSISIFKECCTILYVHQMLDTNNRIIPEAFYYDTKLIIENETDIIDSTIIRYNDILQNGLGNYTIDDSDKMIVAMNTRSN